MRKLEPPRDLRSLVFSPATWMLAFAGWTLVGIVIFAQMALVAWSSAASLPSAEAFADVAESIWLWALLTPPMLYVAARFPLDRAGWRRNVGRHVVAALLFAGVDVLIDTAVAPWLGIQPLGLAHRFARELFVNLFSYTLVVSIGHAVAYQRLYNARRLREIELEAQVLDAQLRALETQLQPHFLFNALHTVTALVRTGRGREAVQVIADLGDLLRTVLETSEAQEVPLHREIELVDRYVGIERARFADRLETRIDVDPEALDALVPRLILQPLVENAVRHGIEPSLGAGAIDVCIGREREWLRIEVRDTGGGPGSSLRRGRGVGLANTRERLRALYGEAFELDLVPADGGGARALVAIPFHTRALVAGAPA